jgi:hypothetical protein
MDDIDIGVDSIAEAKAVLRDLDLSLQTRQIRLNSGKTRILAELEARKHFKIRENIWLDRFAERIDAKVAAKLPLDKERRAVELAIRAGFRRNVFVHGNGDKIFKRLIHFGRQVRARLSDELLTEALYNWPGIRSAILSWWQHSAKPEKQLPIFSHLLAEGGLVDDAANMDVAMALVSARLPLNKVTNEQIAMIMDGFDEKTPWGFYAKAWLMSKYGTADQLIDLIETKVSLWIAREHLSRVVAGLFPRFIGSPHLGKFEAIVRRAGNSWSISVLQFHLDLTVGTKGYTGIKNFVLARNLSLPNGISHPKFLMLLSLLSNPDIAPTAVAKLKKVHAGALSDPYYALHFGGA